MRIQQKTALAKRRSGESGFTMLELMIVITVISILAVIAVPYLADAKRGAYQKSAVQTLRMIFRAQQDFHKSNGRYAEGLPDLVAAGVLGHPFEVSVFTLQPSGPWEFVTGIPQPSTSSSVPPPTADGNKTVRFRVVAQPRGASPEERQRVSVFMIAMTEEGRFFMHTCGGDLDHAFDTTDQTDDIQFGDTSWPPLDDTGA